MVSVPREGGEGESVQDNNNSNWYEWYGCMFPEVFLGRSYKLNHVNKYFLGRSYKLNHVNKCVYIYVYVSISHVCAVCFI